MKKQIVSIIVGIFLISLVSAYNITAGESINITLSEEYDYYSIVGNLTPIDLNITQEGTIVTILTDKYMSSDSFEIIFFNKEKEVIHHYSSGGTRRVTTEKEKIVEVDNYVDREIYIINDTEIQRLDDELRKIQDELNKKNKRITFLLFGISILLCAFLFLLIYTLRKSIKNLMNRLTIFKKNEK